MNELRTINIVELEPEAIYVVHEKFERKFDKHLHSKGQLSYVEDGIAYVTFENQQLVVPAKHFIWIPKETPHQLKVSHSATQLHSIYFPENKKHKSSFYDQFGIYPANDLIIALIRFTERWNKEFVHKKTPFYELIEGLYHLIAEEKLNRLDIMLPVSNDSKMTKITDFIQSHFGEHLTVELMTQKFNMSERTFTRWFKKELGITFMQYLKSVRMMQAIDFLLKTNLSISEIANKVGYNSLPSFSTIFYEYTGKRPHDMRKGFDL